MAAQAPSKKRARTANEGGSYHYSVPDPADDYREIHNREGRLLKVGSAQAIRTAPPERIVQYSSSDWQATTAWLPPDDTQFALDLDPSSYADAVDALVMEELPLAEPPKKKAKSKVSKRPHVVWKETYRTTYLDEIIRWDGRADFMAKNECGDCISRKVNPAQAGEYRCRECFVPDLVCQSCCIRRHRVHPLHHVEHWSGSHFIRVALRDLGLRVQLNHSGSFCEHPVPCHSSMVVIHVNGLHRVSFDYCGCSRTAPQHIQLLRRGFYPATQQIVKTCGTFQLLDLLHKLALTTKAATYDFYRGLEMMTNNAGLVNIKSRYRALYRVNIQWRHLKLLKRGGRGHDPSGPEGTQPGELAVPCPSCPRPGINLPEGWATVPTGMKFLYYMFACMDANFRLKNQLVSNYSQDPGLGIGMAYMVPRQGYEEYVLNRTNDQDISTCVGFQALAQANNRFSKGLRYTGVGGVFCGRSEMVLPNGIGNLQKGERYSNMDFIFGAALHTFGLLLPVILISYDIACQWFVNLQARMDTHWPSEIQFPPTTKFIPAIPKLHEPMHQTANHQVYSLNYIPGVGDSDFECPERVWAGHNPVGNSTKTQGPGSRQDGLDDNFAAWNWWKYIGIGKTLSRKLRAAVVNRNLQVEAHRGLTDGLEDGVAEKWDDLCVAWEKDGIPKKKKNPYHTEGIAMTEGEAKKQLSLDEEKRLASGGTSYHTTSAPAFVVMGLEIEESQRRLRRLAKDTGAQATARREGGLVEQRNQLTNRLRVWEQLLPIYLPGLLQHQSDLRKANGESPKVPENPEDIPLWMPSRLDSKIRNHICSPGLPAIEEKMRTAQCHDALDSLRHILKIKARLVKFKNNNVRGQREGTRSRAIIDRVHDRARFTADKYRSARVAKMALSGPGKWESELNVLADADIRGYQDPELLQKHAGRKGTLEDHQVDSQDPDVNMSTPAETADFSLLPEERSRRDGTGETHRILSWIWRTKTGMDDPENADDDILRSEWAKSRARANRSKEEVMLIREEMRRTIEFLPYRANWWRERIGLRDVDKVLAEGLRACAENQADVQTALEVQFRTLWRLPFQGSPSQPPTDQPVPTASSSSPPNLNTSTPHSCEGHISSEPNVQASALDGVQRDEDEDEDDDDNDEEDFEDGGRFEDDFNLYI